MEHPDSLPHPDESFATDLDNQIDAEPPDDVEALGLGVESNDPEPAAADPHDALAARIDELAELMAGMKIATEKFHERSEAHEDLIRKLNVRTQELQDNQVLQFLKPAFDDLAMLRGLVSDALERTHGDLSAGILHEDLTMIHGQVDSVLAMLGIEPVQAENGTAYDRRKHSVAKTLATTDPDLDRTVERTLREGLVHIGSDQVLIPAKAYVYRYEADATPDSSESEQVEATGAAPPADDEPHAEHDHELSTEEREGKD